MEISIREFYIETDGRRIFSKLYQPLAQGRLPLVIFSHGLGADNMNFEGYARAVAPLGLRACVLISAAEALTVKAAVKLRI